MIFTDLSKEEQREVLEIVRPRIGDIPLSVIEKDWWVTMVLRALFSLHYADQLSFKGGTSLSKCWNLIKRFSEDIDIAINREYLGFAGQLSKTQISDKLRRASCSFTREKLKADLEKALTSLSIDPSLFEVTVNVTSISTTDPEMIEVAYESLFSEETDYLKPVVKIEVSGRSMSEPLESVTTNSWIEQYMPNTPFVQKEFKVLAVSPERTFIEKLCLLHEEFAKKEFSSIRSERMSRHLYDVYKISKTEIATRALSDPTLYASIVQHRGMFIGLKGFDYLTLAPQTLSIVPPKAVLDEWRSDYIAMSRDMIYEETPSIDSLLNEITELNKGINKIAWALSL